MSKPLFMWAGGKNKLLKIYKDFFPDEIDSYYEPFFGGGAVYIYVKETYNPKKMVINDINKDVMRIYSSVKNKFDNFTKRLDYLESLYIPLTKEDRKKLYYEVRQEHAYDFEKFSPEEEAATLYFLMKTGFNGIFQINQNTNGRYGTPAGLLNQKTEVYKRDVVKWWHEALQNTEIMSEDWRSVKYTYGNKSFAFFDPPYRLSFADYGNSFGDKDLIDLVEEADKFENVMLSNRNDDDWFDRFDNSLNRIDIEIKYTAGRRKKVGDTFEAKKAKEILMYK